MAKQSPTGIGMNKARVLNLLTNLHEYLSIHPDLQAECKELAEVIAHLDTWLIDLTNDPQADREQLGQLVRAIWITWAERQPNPKPSWLIPWQGLEEPDREVDRMIGAGIAQTVRAGYNG